MLIVLKFVSWSISLGSGTSGGTLAPLFTIGGGIGALFGGAAVALAPTLGVDPHVAALVGMAAIFAGASHALLASVVFAFETTRQPMGLLPAPRGMQRRVPRVAAADAQLDHDGEARSSRHARAHGVQRRFSRSRSRWPTPRRARS